MSNWEEADILQRLGDIASPFGNDRSYIYPDLAIAILKLIKDRDATIKRLGDQLDELVEFM